MPPLELPAPHKTPAAKPTAVKKAKAWAFKGYYTTKGRRSGSKNGTKGKKQMEVAQLQSLLTTQQRAMHSLRQVVAGTMTHLPATAAVPTHSSAPTDAPQHGSTPTVHAGSEEAAALELVGLSLVAEASQRQATPTGRMLRPKRMRAGQAPDDKPQMDEVHLKSEQVNEVSTRKGSIVMWGLGGGKRMYIMP
jgi:hypothetical protein